MKVGNRGNVKGLPSFCRWADVIGRNRTQLERVRTRLALPARLVALSLSEHLHPTAIRVGPTWFVVTYFTSPSRREVFARQPVFLWLADYSIVTISPWARRQSVLRALQALNTTRDGLVCSVLEAAVASHEEVGRQLNDAFFLGHDGGESPDAWHRKERRVAGYGQLLAQQLQLLHAVGIRSRQMRQVHEQLKGLLEIARSADRKLRTSGYCRICKRAAVRGQRGGD
jgi:hypothetical protein